MTEDWVMKIDYIKSEMLRLKNDNNNLIRSNIRLMDEIVILKKKIKEKNNDTTKILQ
jgi:hypothetical protein